MGTRAVCNICHKTLAISQKDITKTEKGSVEHVCVNRAMHDLIKKDVQKLARRFLPGWHNPQHLSFVNSPEIFIRSVALAIKHYPAADSTLKKIVIGACTKIVYNYTLVVLGKPWVEYWAKSIFK